MSPVENETSNQSKGRKLSSMEIFFIVFVTIILIFDQLAIGGGDNFTSICIVTFYGLATQVLRHFIGLEGQFYILVS